MQCIKVLISDVEKCFERCPLNSLVVRMSTCILPNSLAQSTHEPKRDQMTDLLCHIISLGILTASFSDKVTNQFWKFLSTECTTNRDIFIDFDRSNKRPDDFYFKDINITIYPDLASALKLVLTLSHGQAWSSTIYQQTALLESALWEITCSPIISSPTMFRLHQTWKLLFNMHIKITNLHSRQESKKEKSPVENQKAIILSDIEDVKSQITFLTKTSVILEKEFVLSVKQVEKENDISLVS